MVVKQVRLGPEHRPTGKTRHYLGAVELPPASMLRIMRYPNEPGFYLLYFDDNDNELTDTFHDTLEGAFKQAEFEYGVEPDEWQTIHDNN
jgi:hypothetical protein